MGNNIKTVFLLGLLTGIILFIGSFWGQGGLTLALAICVVMNFVSYFFSDKIALSMYHAQQVTREDAPQIYRILEHICLRQDIPMPKVYVIPDESPNAFATGRNPEHASVAVTNGALRLLDENELTGVLAHEMAHVKHRDILIASVAATLAGVIMWVANMARFAAIFGGGRSGDGDDDRGGIGGLVTIIVAPIAAMLIQMWISRTREFQADAGAAEVVGSHGLVSALRKLENYSKRIPMDASPSTAHMMIVNPFSGKSLMNLFSTHPPTEKRIERLLSET
ncbi:MAG: zinc metalloprotease HtpX [Acidobacteriota bacterium]|jgi:heat shock protein HtpX|nr:zinc metalloprotease HtpX [Acidobacteriota bacterium]